MNTACFVCGEVVVEWGRTYAEAVSADKSNVVVAFVGAVARGIYEQFVNFKERKDFLKMPSDNK
jgi:hypothetical protein